MSRIDDMPTEFEWKMFPGITTLGFLEKIQSLMRPTVWTWALQWQDHLHVNVQWHCMARKRKQRKMWIQFTDSCESCSQILSGHLSFLGPRSEEEWCGTYTDKHDGSWDQTAENMMSNFSGSGHPIFRASSAFERGELRSKEGRKKSFDFNGSNENIKLLLRTVISSNLLSVYGAVAHLCNELSKGVRVSENPDALDHLEKMEIPTDLSIAETPTNA